MEFICGNHKFTLGEKCYVFGILNFSAESVSNAGRSPDPADAVRRAVEMAQEGADCIDISVKSTRPGCAPISPETEIQRLQHILPAVVQETGLPVAVDTSSPEVAAYCAENGAVCINGVDGEVSPHMADIIEEYELGWIIMHAREISGPGIVREVHDWLEHAAQEAYGLGVSSSRICLDPGIGFGKDAAGCLALIDHTAQIKVEDFAYMVGASRKEFITAYCGDLPPQQRDPGTIAAHTAAILGGADFIRVHDVQSAVQAARIASAIRGNQL